MNVTITENPRLVDIEVTVACPRIDERVQRIVAGLSTFDRKLTGESDGATYRLDLDDVCYAETVDGRTFLYTKDAVYQTPLRLYELEDQLAGTEFIRASKQLLANFDHVKAIRPEPGAREAGVVVGHRQAQRHEDGEDHAGAEGELLEECFHGMLLCRGGRVR